LGEVSPVSVNVELRALRTILFLAVRWQLLESNPFSKAKLVSVPEMEPTHFSKEDFQRLLGVIKEQWLKDLILFTVTTGLRRAEVLNCQWKDVELDRRLVHIHSTPTFRVKCGKRRTIPLNGVATQILLAKRSRNESGDYVFTLNGRRLLPGFLTHKFKNYVCLAGLTRKLHFHSLRHTFATWLVQDGVSIYEVQKLLGHSSIEMTQVYSHLHADQLHSAVNKLTLSLN